MEQKRVRSRNFTECEKQFLFELVTKDYKHIVENKQTDAVTVAKKNLAWQEIAKKFARQSRTGHRSAKQLHALYDNMKKTARSNFLSDKKNFYTTGDGRFQPKSSALDNKIVSTLKLQFEPLKSQFNSTATYFDVNPSCSKDEGTSEVDIEDIPLVIDDTSPAMEESPQHLPLKSEPESDMDSPVSNEAPLEDALVGLAPAHVRSTMRQRCKRKLSVAKTSQLETMSKRFVQRKNFKDMHDKQIQKERLDILKIEKEIKKKQLIVVEEQLTQQRKMFELNCQARLDEIAFDKKVREMKLQNLQKQYLS